MGSTLDFQFGRFKCQNKNAFFQNQYFFGNDTFVESNFFFSVAEHNCMRRLPDFLIPNSASSLNRTDVGFRTITWLVANLVFPNSSRTNNVVGLSGISVALSTRTFRDIFKDYLNKQCFTLRIFVDHERVWCIIHRVSLGNQSYCIGDITMIFRPLRQNWLPDPSLDAELI